MISVTRTPTGIIREGERKRGRHWLCTGDGTWAGSPGVLETLHQCGKHKPLLLVTPFFVPGPPTLDPSPQEPAEKRLLQSQLTPSDLVFL